MRLTTMKRRLGAIAVAAATASAIGCGGSSSSDSRFLGTWKITQASADVSCDDGTSGTFTPTGNLEFAPGTSSAIVAISPAELDPASFCDFGFDVKGAVATIQANQTCVLQSFSVGTGAGEAVFSPTSWQFSITGPDAGEEMGTATITLPLLDSTGTQLLGTTLCQYTGHMATLKRVARN